LSIGLDSVATWCFDSQGEWTGGVGTSKTRGKKSAAAARPNPDAEPTAECKKAVTSCVSARAAVASQSEGSDTANAALADWKRPYHEATYPPKRSGVTQRPVATANCESRTRSELFSHAQSRMDLARWFSMVQSEYSDYRAWLMQESLKCRKNVLANTKDPLRSSMSVDAPAEAATGSVARAATQKEPPDAGVLSANAEHSALTEKPMLEKWKYLAERQSELERERDYSLGFLASRELRACSCTRVNATAMARAIEKQEGGSAGLALLNSEDAANTKCAVCLLDAFTAWKPRISRQCAMMDELTEFELNKLQQADDANGLPPRCFEETRTRRAEKNKALASVAVDAGAPWEAVAKAMPAAQMPAAMLPARDGGALWAEVNGYTYYKPAAPKSDPGTLTGPGVGSSTPTLGDEFVPPNAYAPIPTREDGRVYVRLSMSAACIAEILPGPIQARTGDLLLVPFGAKSLQVKSPCGGLAEIYFGREARPRFSEVFTRTQPLSFVFQAQ
jgi:hypothetical protein